MKASRKIKHPGVQPVVRLRVLLNAIALVSLASVGPLFTVWKQVYTRSASIRREALADSLAACNREILTLRLAAANLASTRRIENIARTSLGLDYPSSDRIVVLRQTDRTQGGIAGHFQFPAIIRRSLRQGRGS